MRMGLFFRLDEYAEDFPTGTPRDFIRIIQNLLQEIAQAIDDAEDHRDVLLLCHLIEELTVAIEWVDNAHTAQTPRGLTEFLGDISSTLDSKAQLFVAPSIEYNYSIIDLVPWLHEVTENVLPKSVRTPFLETLPAVLNLVRFPRI